MSDGRLSATATINITDDKDSSLKWTYTEVGSDGKVSKSSYSGAFDGKQYPVTGAADSPMKSAAFRRSGNTTTIAWMMKDGSTMKETSTVSGDTMTSVAEEKDGSKSTGVYERVKSGAAAASKGGAKPAAGADAKPAKKPQGK